ncbi:hypothetical protein [Hymenobacter fodinae]|uniref:Uncharacterized protein n=1 Tax=Hymenobacter fodinae TaxID=2510796 RepID=A0A4Z0P8G4_9BACT|nr:hypothetical protein [Hymenobacter fodinae]TGE08255.1 hypothetical protein EU556_11065 [Hymenobacter fodinae]
MQYNPKVFAGKHAQDIIALVILANRTIGKGIVRFLPEIKNEETITTISGDIEWVDYKEDIKETDLAGYEANNSLKFSDRTVNPKKIMALDGFSMEDLRNSRFSEDMLKGAANITSNKFEQTVIAYVEPRLGKNFEKLIWGGVSATDKAKIAASANVTDAQKAWAAGQKTTKTTGLLAAALVAATEDADGKVIAVSPTGTIDASNIAANYKRIHSALPVEVSGKATLFVPEGDFALILQANDNETYRDKFTVSGDDIETAVVKYLGMKIEFVPINYRIAGLQTDFVVATDLLSDASSFEIGKVNNLGDKKFGKAVAVVDTTLLLPQQKVVMV